MQIEANKILPAFIAALFLVSASFAFIPSASATTATCTTVNPTSTEFGSSPTAAVVAVAGETITGTIDATGCDIGVYIGSGITGVTVTATVQNANKVGVFNDGGTATVTGSTITEVGNHAGGTFSPNGAQTGIGVYYSCAATGIISSNSVNEYQKGGITVRDLDGVTITSNTVTGLGPVNFIAQNGIESGFSHSCGATITASNVGHITGNSVSGNIYTQLNGARGYVSTGILVEAPAGQSTGQLTSALHTSNTVFNSQSAITVIVG